MLRHNLLGELLPVSVKPCDVLGVLHIVLLSPPKRESLNYTTQPDPTYLSSLTTDKSDPFHDKSFGFQA